MSEKLRLEVNSRSVAAIHVERYGLMLMRDFPLTVDFAETESLAHPDVRFLAVAPRSAYSVETVAEGDCLASRDVQVANLVANRALKRGKPLLHAILPGTFISLELKGRRENKHNGLRRIVRRYAVGILGADGVCQLVPQRRLLSEVGVELGRFQTEKHFSSWLSLSPERKVSGGKFLSSKTKASSNRAAQAFRQAAVSVQASDSELGAYYRRMKARLGGANAVMATAHKLARVYYRMVKRGKEYEEAGARAYEKKHRQRVVSKLEKRARGLGLELVAVA